MRERGYVGERGGCGLCRHLQMALVGSGDEGSVSVGTVGAVEVRALPLEQLEVG